MDAEIIDNPEENRFEMIVEGRRVGFLAYERILNELTVTHIETEPELAGRGLGLVLVRGSLDLASAQSMRVRPREPFVRGFIARHPVYHDLLPADARADVDRPDD
jgi:predicted GNAT family acetyltransferase